MKFQYILKEIKLGKRDNDMGETENFLALLLVTKMAEFYTCNIK
jgi:hypothetical protein